MALRWTNTPSITLRASRSTKPRFSLGCALAPSITFSTPLRFELIVFVACDRVLCLAGDGLRSERAGVLARDQGRQRLLSEIEAVEQVIGQRVSVGQGIEPEPLLDEFEEGRKLIERL